MDLPRLGDDVAPNSSSLREPASDDFEMSDLPSSEVQESSPQRRAHPAPEPLPAWLRGDEQLFGEDEYEDQDPYDDPAAPMPLRGFRWIRKNMTSLKVTVSVKRPTPPPPGKPRSTP